MLKVSAMLSAALNALGFGGFGHAKKDTHSVGKQISLARAKIWAVKGRRHKSQRVRANRRKAKKRG